MENWGLWRDPEQWPFIAPEHVFFADGALQILTKMFGDYDWAEIMGHRSMGGIVIAHPALAFDARGEVHSLYPASDGRG